MIKQDWKPFQSQNDKSKKQDYLCKKLNDFQLVLESHNLWEEMQATLFSESILKKKKIG